MAEKALDGELVEAMADAARRGVGYVRIRRITTEQFRLGRLDPSTVVVLDGVAASLEAIRTLIYRLPCSYCTVTEGACITTGGHRSHTFHTARSGPVYEAWRHGYRDGLVDAFRRLVNDWDTPTVELLARHGVSW